MVMRGKSAWWLLCLCLVAWPWLSSQAEAGYVVADVDKAQGSTDDQFMITVVVNGKLKDEPSFPNVPGLKVVSQQSGSSIKIINGDMTREQQYVFYVAADKNGTYTIPPFVLNVDGKDESTAALTIKVAEDSSDHEGGAAQDVIIKRVLRKKEFYVGEAVSSTVKISHKVKLFDPQAEQAEAPGLKRIDPNQQESGDDEVDGAAYKTITLGEVWVAKKAGKTTIPGFGLSIRKPVVSRGLDVFGLDAAYGKRKKYRSRAEDVTVKALPEANQPPNFSGLVGHFTLAAQVSQRALKVGDTVNVQVELSGQGSAEGLANLTLDPQLPVRVYADKPEYKETVTTSEGLTSLYKVSLAVVPTSPGTINLGRLTIPTFNPDSGKYEDVSADLGSIDVSGAAAAGGSKPLAPSAPVKENRKPGSIDPGSLRTVADLHQGSALSSGEKWSAVILVFLALFGNVFAFFFQHWWSGKGDRMKLKRQSTAVKRLVKSLDKVQSQNAAQTSLEQVEEAAAAFTHFLQDKWTYNVSGVTPKDLGQLLQAQGIAPQERVTVVKTWEVIEKARFGGHVPDSQEWQHVIASLKTFAQGVERT